MFPSDDRAEPQGFALRPGPLPPAPFPVKGPDPPVGLAGLACSEGRLSPFQSLRHQQNVEGGLSLFLSVLPPGERRGVADLYSKKRANAVRTGERRFSANRLGSQLPMEMGKSDTSLLNRGRTC